MAMGSPRQLCATGHLQRPWAGDWLWNHSQPKGSASSYLVPRTGCTGHALLQRLEPPEYARITLGYLYYCNPHELQLQIAGWKALPGRTAQQLCIIVVDDGSPEGHDAAGVAARAGCTALNLVIMRVEQDIDWNIGGGRNLIVAVAPTDYVMLLDLDVVVPPSLAALLPELVKRVALFEHNRKRWLVMIDFPRVSVEGTVRRPMSRPHPGVALMRRKTYWRAGGCDEDFSGGYGSTDKHFRARIARTAGLGVHSLQSSPLLSPFAELHQLTGGGGRHPLNYTCVKESEFASGAAQNRSRNLRLLAAKQQGSQLLSVQNLVLSVRT